MTITLIIICKYLQKKLAGLQNVCILAVYKQCKTKRTMYLVTNETPTEVLSREFWSSKLGAEVRRAAINKQSGINNGAIVVDVHVKGAACIKDIALMVGYEGGDIWDAEFSVILDGGIILYCLTSTEYRGEVAPEGNYIEYFKNTITSIDYTDEDLDRISIDLPEEMKAELAKAILEFTQEHNTFEDEINDKNRNHEQ